MLRINGLLLVALASVLFISGPVTASASYADAVHDFNFISQFDRFGNSAYSAATFPANGLETTDGVGIILAGYDVSSDVLSSPFNLDFVTVHMSAPVQKVDGPDLLIVDTESGVWADKLAEVFVSSDGSVFTSVGTIFGSSGNDGSVDFGSFAGEVNYVKLQTSGFPDAHITIDAIVQPAAVIPLPPAVWLFGSGLLGLVGFARKRCT